MTDTADIKEGASPRDLDRLVALETGQQAMITALGLMLETMQKHTDLLVELVDAAREDSGDSPIMHALEELTAAVVQVNVGLNAVALKIEHIPQAVADRLSPQAEVESS